MENQKENNHLSRRGFLRNIALGTGATILFSNYSLVTWYKDEEGILKGIVVDFDKCTGCKTCETACSAFNHKVKVNGKMVNGLGNPWLANIRVHHFNPDVDIHGHPYISTGKSINKFGIDINCALEVFLRAHKMPAVEIVGVHCHIGSQILNLEYYVATAKKLFDFVQKISGFEIKLQHVDIGGGLGVHYPAMIADGTDRVGERVPSPAELAQKVIAVLKPLNCEILFEPGRSIIGETGALITKVLYVKKSRDKNFVVVDAGMNDLIRPSLYDAYHQIVPLKRTGGKLEKADVVGPICETGDFLAKDRSLPNSQQGDYLAVMTAGAYGYSLSSNYNSRPRPIEVWVDGDRDEVIREREKVEDFI